MTKIKMTTQKDFEKEYKSKLFDNIYHLCTCQAELIEKIKKSVQDINIELDGTISNIGITFNNKIVELLHIFENAGISMFSQEYENFATYKSDFISSSFIGDALIFYMLEQVEDATKSLYKFHSKISSFQDLKLEKSNAYQNASSIKKLSLAIRSLISIPEELLLIIKNEDIEELNSYLHTHEDIDNKLWETTLSEIIVPSLVEHIKRNKYSKEHIPELLDKAIIPYLEKLELTDLIPELKQQIIKIYEQPKVSFQEER